MVDNCLSSTNVTFSKITLSYDNEFSTCKRNADLQFIITDDGECHILLAYTNYTNDIESNIEINYITYTDTTKRMSVMSGCSCPYTLNNRNVRVYNRDCHVATLLYYSCIDLRISNNGDVFDEYFNTSEKIRFISSENTMNG
jgi:hypothetical protein